MTRHRLVCVVDDDESLGLSLKNLLSSVGYEVNAFASAEAFLASTAIDKTVCLVLDQRLEGMSGLELMAQLFTSGRSTPVIMLTAHGGAEVRRLSLQLGAVAFLAKPFRPEDLLAAIKTVEKHP
jgi:FixJ family two-component response regulator